MTISRQTRIAERGGASRVAARRLEKVIASVVLVGSLMTVAAPAPASAQWYDAGKYDAGRKHPHTIVAARTSAPVKPAAPVAKTPSPLMAVISISSQRLAIYDSTGAIIHAPVSTGQPGHRTPLGVFSVIQKDRYHESNIYSGAPMPYMQRITWSGIAMHEGALPGYPASHGCIRMPGGIAQKLFGMTKLGMRVVVSPHDTGATPFSHPALPVPLMTPAPAGDEQASIRQGALTSGLVRVAEVGTRDAAPAPVADPGTRLFNPMQRAQYNRVHARADAVAAVKAAKVALEHAQETAAEANQAAAELRAAVAAQHAAEADLAAVRARAQQAATPEAQRDAAQAVADAETKLNDMNRALTEARAAEAVRTPESFAAAVASREADEAIDTTEKLAKAAEKAVEPVSVFISRKEGKLLVRQAFQPLFEAPVTFKGEAPLGTHLYVAMASDDANQLKWLSVSVPNSSGAAVEHTPVKRGQPAPAAAGRASTAAEALERVEIPDDVKAQIADRMWLGGSVIISDLGVSNETGQGTDFVVLTR